MYRPSLKSGWSLILLFIFSVILYLIAQSSYVTIKADNYEKKVEAATLMASFIDTLRAEQVRLGIPFDPIDDPDQTGLIGAARTTITTDRGSLSDKQAALNPNLAAIFVEEFSRAGLKAGDFIAVGITGSNPAVNLSLYAAIKAMELKPSIIVSLSSASYGANREEYTWLDMEAILKRRGLIDFGAAYASLGGKDDLGVGLSDDGIKALLAAMSRNGVDPLLGSTLEDNVKAREIAYAQLLPQGSRYKLFVNIGRGLANVGSEPNANQILEGMNRRLAEETFVPEGIMMVMARENVPVFSMQHAQRWIRRYNLQSTTGNMPEPGVGPAFSLKKHNVTVAAVCLVLLLAAIIAVIILDRHDRHFMSNIVDPDEEL
ncbi:MAG: poly-gamma-glutamate system protein [Candidatus Syntrophosphaera sp.]|nr:poly-gamma-glutamate system protein [Candidatus Syntrophosphaera sp.]